MDGGFGSPSSSVFLSLFIHSTAAYFVDVVLGIEGAAVSKTILVLKLFEG